VEDAMSKSHHELIAAEDEEKEQAVAHDRVVTRRLFLQQSTAAVASAGVATIGAAVALDGQSATAQDATPTAGSVELGTSPPSLQPRPIQFFNPHESSTVDALVSRIMPGTDDDPGAHEAGVVFYIDESLHGTNLGYTLKTYAQGPYLVTSDEPMRVEAASSRDIYDYVMVAGDQASRYGYQSVLTPQEIYRRGIEFVDAYAQDQFENNFVDLSEDQQDQILTDMEADKATGFEGPSGKAFFTQLRNDTIEGMFSDPMYGGNRGLVGWKLIGYPGAQRNYTPDDMKNPNFSREPQSLAQMMAMEGH
jgi:gluconate 2-dehydrogenase gamma chain